MVSIEMVLIGGVAMGLASALHCGAMCSGICGSALLLLQPQTQRHRIVTLLLLQGGRITIYILLGAGAACLGSTLITPATVGRFRTLQWAGAVAMMGMGLAMAGLLPRLAYFDRGAGFLQHSIERAVAPLRRWPRLGPYAMGMIWGANACPMVYGAVFTAALAGSVPRGAIFMAGFGLGTLPALLAAGYGASLLKTLSNRAPIQAAAGIVLAILGYLSLFPHWPATSLFCVTR